MKEIEIDYDGILKRNAIAVLGRELEFDNLKEVCIRSMQEVKQVVLSGSWILSEKIKNEEYEKIEKYIMILSCMYHNIDLTEIKSRNRKTTFVNSRIFIVYILRRHYTLNYTPTRTARLMHRDHSSVLNLQYRISKALDGKDFQLLKELLSFDKFYKDNIGKFKND